MDQKIFEERLFILTISTMFLRILFMFRQNIPKCRIFSTYLHQIWADGFSRWHRLLIFSLRRRHGSEIIWRKVVHFNYLNNVCSNVIQNMLCKPNVKPVVFTDNNDLSRRHHLYQFSQKLTHEWKNIWRKVVHFTYLNNVSSNLIRHQ
jgi:hypothetical protein